MTDHRTTAEAVNAALNRRGTEKLNLQWRGGAYRLQHRRAQRNLQDPDAGVRYSSEAPWVDVPGVPPLPNLAAVATHLGLVRGQPVTAHPDQTKTTTTKGTP